jgi:hypothetical protein
VYAHALSDNLPHSVPVAAPSAASALIVDESTETACALTGGASTAPTSSPPASESNGRSALACSSSSISTVRQLTVRRPSIIFQSTAD